MADNKVKLTVAGITIVVTTPEEESYALKLSETMDRDMQLLLSESSAVSVTSAAILCAIDYLDKFQKANKSVANMRSQIKEYLAEAANSKMLYDDEKKRTLELESEVKALREQLNKFAASGREFELAAENFDELRQSNLDIAEQCRSLNDRVVALNDYIAAQDRELEALKTAALEKDQRIAAQSKNIADLEAANQTQRDEITKLKEEVEVYEQLLSEEAAKIQTAPSNYYPQPYPAPPAQQYPQQPYQPVPPQQQPVSPAPAPQQPQNQAAPAQQSFFSAQEPAGNSPLPENEGFSDGFIFQDLQNSDPDINRLLEKSANDPLYSDLSIQAQPPHPKSDPGKFPFGEDIAKQQNKKDEDGLPNLSWTEDI